MIDPFCDREQYSKTIFYRSKSFMALYNIRPVLPGHSLLIPIRHVTRITELSDNEAKEMIIALREVIPVLIELYGADDDSYNMDIQSGPSSGRTIDHLHLHIVPRKPDDRYRYSSSFSVDISKSLDDLGPKHVKKEVERLREKLRFNASET